MPPRNANPTEELDRFVAAKIESGLDKNASERGTIHMHLSGAAAFKRERRFV
jgi:hypothetical protein